MLHGWWNLVDAALDFIERYPALVIIIPIIVIVIIITTTTTTLAPTIRTLLRLVMV
jgi:hypothetical protein